MKVTFKVNPYTVIKPFTFEFEEGELTKIGSDFKLCIRLLVYDKNGILYWDTEDDSFNNYQVVMSKTSVLPVGEYTAVAISTLRKNTNIGETKNKEYWVIQNKENLNAMTISPIRLIGGPNEMLGITNKAFTVSHQTSSNLEVHMDIEPAGGLLAVLLINTASEDFNLVNQYQLNIDKLLKEYSFGLNGNYETSMEIGNGSDKRISVWRRSKGFWTGGKYSFHFLPKSVYKLSFAMSASNNDWEGFSQLDDMNLNNKIGSEHIAYLNVGNEDYDTDFYIDGDRYSGTFPALSYELIQDVNSSDTRAIETIDKINQGFTPNLIRDEYVTRLK